MKTLAAIFVLALLFSCRHESDQTADTDNTVITGDSHRNYTIIKPGPAIVVTATHQDSLDLNSDGIFEIRFIIAPIPTSTVPGSKTIISTKNKLQILLSGLNYEDPDTLSIQAVLNSNSKWSELDPNWSATKSYLFTLYSYACYTYNHCLGSGNFNQVSGKYMGYKIGDKFGWILVDSSPSELKIKEYTVLK